MSGRAIASGLLVWLVACGTPVERDPGTPGAVFPHPAEYTAHGTDYLGDPSSCAGCHADGLADRSGPGCQSCHAYPHPADIAGVHGGAWRADPAACTPCHGEAGDQPPAEVASATCTGCHHTFPHAADPVAQHGAWVLERGGPEACRSCHPAWSTEPGACASCHPAYPHPDHWRADRAHDRQAAPDCTEGCHDSSASPSCSSCHDTYPHPAGWSRSHLAPVVVRGEQPCLACHGAGTLIGPALPVTCDTSCHGGAP